jgi:hypothetical protein
MKVRHGFVSNSSTSSFICIGFMVPEKAIDIYVFAKKYHPKSYGLKEYEALIGKPDKERGCEHPESTAKFCPECGKAMWVESEAVEEREELLREMSYDMEGNSTTPGLFTGEKCPKDGYAVVGFSPIGVSGDGVSAADIDMGDLLARLVELKNELNLPADAKVKMVGGTYAS